MPWQQCSFNCDKQAVDELSDYLQDLGALSLTYSDAADQALFEPPPGATPLWQAVTVCALFPGETNCNNIEQQLLGKYPHLSQQNLSWEQLEDRDWERECLNHFHPMRFGQRTWIVPSWESAPDPNAIIIHLDPGLAFGTGTHATTALCLEWLDQNPPHRQKVLDVGCGSGILSIAAIKHGAKQVCGTDIDPQALQASKENAIKNNCLDKIILSLPEQLGDTGFDLILANILANPLCEMAETLTRLLKPQARIVLSGILKHQAEAVIDRYKQWFSLDPITGKEDWVRITGTKRDI